jgi:hypothetical protein
MDKSIVYKKSKNAAEAYTNVKGAVTPEYIEKFKVSAKIKYDEKKKLIIADGTGFTLEISFTEKEVGLNLKLSLILRPIKGKVLETLEREIKKHV